MARNNKFFSKIKILFNNLYWKRKYNTLQNKYQVNIEEKDTMSKEMISIQRKYITVLEKSSTLAKDLKEVKVILNERKK